MKLKRTGLVRVGAWILTGLLAADIGLQLGGGCCRGKYSGAFGGYGRGEFGSCQEGTGR